MRLLFPILRHLGLRRIACATSWVDGHGHIHASVIHRVRYVWVWSRAWRAVRRRQP